MTEEDSVVTFDSCEHLRFCYHPDWDDFEFSNDWDADGFLELVEKAREIGEEQDILDILGVIQHHEVNKMIL